MTLTDATGILAASLVLLTFCNRNTATLRLCALASNIAFVVYGVLLDQPPIWLLHTALIPINALALSDIWKERAAMGKTPDRAQVVPSRIRPRASAVRRFQPTSLSQPGWRHH